MGVRFLKAVGPSLSSQRLEVGYVFLLVVFLQVFGGHETLSAVPAFVLRLHHVDLRLHVAVEVGLCHSFVVAEFAVELANSYNNRMNKMKICRNVQGQTVVQQVINRGMVLETVFLESKRCINWLFREESTFEDFKKGIVSDLSKC